MDTISKRVLTRLTLQAQEARIRKNASLADSVEEQLAELKDKPTRPEGEPYVYSTNDMKADVEKLLWKACLKVCEYYDEVPDVREMQSIVEAQAADFLDAVEKLMPGDLLGPGEPTTPGEDNSVTLDDED